MRRHRWYRPGAARRGGSRKCIDCGLQRRVKPGTRTAREYRVKPGELWLSAAPYCIAPTAATTPEPAPIETDSPAVWPLVIDDVRGGTVLGETPARTRDRLSQDMRARDVEGRRKYGVPLQVENGRNAAVDAYQEALDLTVYARQQWERHHTQAWWGIYEDALKLAARICYELKEEG